MPFGLHALIDKLVNNGTGVIDKIIAEKQNALEKFSNKLSNSQTYSFIDEFLQTKEFFGHKIVKDQVCTIMLGVRFTF